MGGARARAMARVRARWAELRRLISMHMHINWLIAGPRHLLTLCVYSPGGSTLFALNDVMAAIMTPLQKSDSVNKMCITNYVQLCQIKSPRQ